MKKFNRRDMVEVMPGVKEGINDLCCQIVEVHYSADSRKDLGWATMEASTYPGGFAGFNWQTEQEINFDMTRGAHVFPSFNASVHVTERKRSESSPFRLAFDFGVGNPTVCLLSGVLPDGSCHVYREHYRKGGSAGENAADIYEMLRLFFGSFQDITNIIQLAVGDPHDKDMFLEYARCDTPIYIVGKLSKNMIPINNHKAGYSKINSMFYERIFHCGRYYYGHFIACPKCGKPTEPKPSLTIDPSCHHLISEIPIQVWKEPTRDFYQQEERNIQPLPHDTIDTLRYKVMSHQEWREEAPADEFSDLRADTCQKARWRHLEKREGIENYFYSGPEEQSYVGAL